MALGRLRINTLTPPNHMGRWGQGTGAIFGGTVYDPLGGVLTLHTATAYLTSPVGVVTTEPVYTGGAFAAPWTAAGSSWVAGTGVLNMERTGGFTAGTQIRFKLRLVDATGASSYVSWYTGIGDAPESTDPPSVGKTVRTLDGRLWEIDALEGAPGSVRYRCIPLVRLQGGVGKFAASDLTIVGPRDRLSERILVEE